MGEFKIEIKGVGNHGVDRAKENGENVDFFESGDTTPDAIAKKAVEEMINNGCVDVEATITHWPGQDSEVKDDLVSGTRTGNF